MSKLRRLHRARPAAAGPPVASRRPGFAEPYACHQQKDSRHDEGSLGLRRRQHLQCRNLQKTLHDKNEEFEIERERRAYGIGRPRPAARRQSNECGKGDAEGEDGNRTDHQCGRDPAEGEEEASDAGRRGGYKKNRLPLAEPSAGAERREGGGIAAAPGGG